MTDAIQIVTTVPDLADAERIAAVLVANRLAACVQTSGPIESTYRWKDQVENTSEYRCTIKTLREYYPQVEAQIRELHSYSVPQITATEIVAASQGYLDWIAESVGPAPATSGKPATATEREDDA